MTSTPYFSCAMSDCALCEGILYDTLKEKMHNNEHRYLEYLEIRNER